MRRDESIEREFLGLKNGILDPAAIVHSKADRLTEIDTRTGSHVHHEAGSQFRFIAFHSGLAEALTPENYNQRVEQSHAAARNLAKLAGLPDVEHLGDVSPEVFEAFENKLDTIERKRAAHFFSEVERVDRAVDAWRTGATETLGELMCASGMSSIQNYECGATPVKDLYEILNATEGVHGARFCGPGFRGCCVALVQGDGIEDIVSRAGAAYAQKHPDLAQRSWVLECEIVDGVELIR